MEACYSLLRVGQLTIGHACTSSRAFPFPKGWSREFNKSLMQCQVELWVQSQLKRRRKQAKRQNLCHSPIIKLSFLNNLASCTTAQLGFSLIFIKKKKKKKKKKNSKIIDQIKQIGVPKCIKNIRIKHTLQVGIKSLKQRVFWNQHPF